MNRIQSYSKPLTWFVAALLAALVAGCGGGSATTPALNSDKSISSFTIDGVGGVIDQSAKTIALTVPSGTPVTAMVATFTHTGATVTAGKSAVTQVSGVTANDFTSPQTYVVTAVDGTTASYAVTVTVASASSKAITSYQLAWTSGTPGTATGSISGAASPYAIAVTVPNATDVTALVATFSSSGAGVPTVAGIDQMSGTTSNDFTTAKSYLVTAADASTATYVVTVTIAAVVAAGPPAVNLLSITTNDFVVLATTTITDANPVLGSITGNIGLSPAAGSAITVACAEMQGASKIHASDASYAVVGFAGCAVPTSGLVAQAILDLGTAYTAASDPATPAGVGAANLNVLGGILPAGTNFVPGTYTWGSDLNINGNITLTGSASDVWIFQVSGNLAVASGASVPAGVQVQLVGGAVAANVFWQIAGATATLGTYSTFKGNILTSPSTLIAIQTGAVLHGRALSGTAVTLDGSTVAP